MYYEIIYMYIKYIYKNKYIYYKKYIMIILKSLKYIFHGIVYMRNQEGILNEET